MRKFPHARHERSFFRALHQPDLAILVATAVAAAISPLKRAPYFFLLLAGRWLVARNFSLRDTPFPDGAYQAPRFSLHAHRGAEFHHGLIEISGPSAIEKRLRMQPDLRRGQMDAGESTQHTFDIAVDNRYWLVKSNAGDGSCGVASDAGKREQGFDTSRKPATMRPHQFLCALM